MDNTGNVRLSASLHAGIPGASAYQIAVAHGYVGTEAEWLESLHALINGEAAVQIAAGENVTITLVDGVLTISATGGGGSHPYLSLERKAAYLYEVSFAAIPPDSGIDAAPDGGCTSYVSGGKLYRNLDLGYTDRATFCVRCSGFEGAAVLPGLTDTALDDALIGQLPYHLVDGVNANGIMVTEHVLFNDWAWRGAGETPLTKLPYLILTRVKSMATLADDLADVLPTLCTTPALDAHEYLLQYLVSDGTTTCAILPPTDGGDYEIVDITDNPKLTNFRWVSAETVTRADLQRRPTGVERWNAIPAPLEDLRFTVAYESPDRLSEFIGLRGTTKDSTDAELLAIYADARAAYLDRTRDGETWQTMHSAVYAQTGMESLCVQEDWTRDYAASGGGGGTADHRDLTNRAAADQHPISAVTGLSDALAGKQPTGDYALRSELPEALADLTADAQHRTVTDVEKSTWNAKQNALTADVDYATPEAVQEAISDATTDMATQTWVAAQSYITADDIPVVSVNGKTGTVVLTAADIGIGSVFDLKGSVPTYAQLPASGSKTGDVWYVVDESVGYIWLNDGTENRWEQLGLSVDLSHYVTTTALAAALTGYVQKIAGKGLSTNDFTDAYKTKLDSAITSLVGYATEQWVLSKGYLTEHQSLADYRTAAEQDVIDADKLDAPSTPGTAGQVLTADGDGGQSWQTQPTKPMVVTYDDDTTETINVVVKL